MSLRNPLAHLPKRLLSEGLPRPVLALHRHNGMQSARMASVAPPVTQSATGSKGPTAMVFLNMGGPSTTDQVGDFLSRLFVRDLTSGVPCDPY